MHEKNSLAEELKTIGRTLRDAAVGPLLAAAVVERLDRDWHLYEKEAGGESLSTCLINACGKGRHRGWFLLRFEAVQAFGEAVRRHMHHDAAVWAYNRVPIDSRHAFAEAVATAFIANGKNPITKPQARRIERELRAKDSEMGMAAE